MKKMKFPQFCRRVSVVGFSFLKDMIYMLDGVVTLIMNVLLATVFALCSLFAPLAVDFSPTATMHPELGFPILNINFTTGGDYMHDPHRGIDREIRRDALLCVSNTNPDLTFQNEPIDIRGRGNSSWDGRFGDKRGYQIRFNNEREMLDAGYPARRWVLVANAGDSTLMRNYAFYSLGRSLTNMPFSPNAWLVHLYLNGEYRGVFQLSDHVSNEGDRFNFVDGEFLFEKCVREDLYVDGDTFSMDWPNQTTQSVAEFTSLITNINDVLRRSARNEATRQEVERYIDVPSMVDYYIVQELSKNIDVGLSSNRFHIRWQNGLQRLVGGPIWDFDLSAGNITHRRFHYTEPQGIWAARYNGPARWLRNLMNTWWFADMVAERWTQIRDNQIQDMLDRVYAKANNFSADFERNFERWPDHLGRRWVVNPGVTTSNTVRAITTHRGAVDHFIDWIEQRKVWMDTFLADPTPHLKMDMRNPFPIWRAILIIMPFAILVLAIMVSTVLIFLRARKLNHPSFHS